MIDMEKNIENRSLEIEYVLIAYPSIYMERETWVVYMCVGACKLILVERMCRCPFEVHAAGILTNLALCFLFIAEGVVIPIYIPNIRELLKRFNTVISHIHDMPAGGGGVFGKPKRRHIRAQDTRSAHLAHGFNENTEIHYSPLRANNFENRVDSFISFFLQCGRKVIYSRWLEMTLAKWDTRSVHPQCVLWYFGNMIGTGRNTYRVACMAGSCGLADEMRDVSHWIYVTH